MALLVLTNTSFWGVNRLFVFSFEDNTVKTRLTRYFLEIAEIKDYNIMVDARNLFDQRIKNNMGTKENIPRL